MAHFKNNQQSHQHSLETLDIIYGYDSFLDSLHTVVDMGAGAGLDTHWWATLSTRDDPPEPRNYNCYAVDRDLAQFSKTAEELPNVKCIAADFETKLLSVKADLIWCHDSFQFATNPLATLKQNMNENGMLILILKQNQAYEYNRFVSRTYNHSYFNYNLGNLIYMLAVNGFDCNDAYAYRDEKNNWLHLAVYKSNIEPLNPTITSLYDLVELNLVNPTVAAGISKYGYLRQEDIVYPWLDKDFHRDV